MLCAHGGQKRASNLLKLETQMAVRHHVIGPQQEQPVFLTIKAISPALGIILMRLVAKRS